MCDVPERGCVVEHRPRTLRYRFATKVIFDEPACEHALVLRCQPREGEGLTILKGAVCIEPEVPLQAQRDSFGNALAVCRIAEAHDYVLYVSEGIVRIDLGETGPCVAHPLYRYPSALATASDEMCDWLRAQGLVSGLWEDDPVTQISRHRSSLRAGLGSWRGVHARVGAGTPRGSMAWIRSDPRHVRGRDVHSTCGGQGLV